ncbi:phytoene desaturase family protein [Stratiformator vulcanicus]|uniref:Diapolycopene oxygenase n=1 Tax=Stratiformator vulcanicus TaxID=2527980 RepID=A0A517R5W7_9PLAN|nr:phytoene desaturase family protein [Stratiformator vulcanicus]QDT39294.1 Diapolycopene oxygenase [Stratiformator vulcanicus]
MSIAEPLEAHSTSSASNERIVVIGGGLGGLASACVLAARGYQVTLLDKNEWFGGKAAILHEGGYRFDMGPTIVTLPSVLKRIFAEAGREMADYLDMRPLDPQWRCFFDSDSASGGGVLDLVSDVDQMKQNIAEFTGGSGTSADGYEEFLNYAEKLNGVSDRFFFWKSVGGLMDTFKADGMFDAKVLKDVMSLRMGSSVAGTVRKYVPDERVAQMIDHFTQYVGSAPDQSPAVLCGIAHMQTEEGIWYPIGGTRAVPEALCKLAGELGVEFRPSTHVAHIETQNGRTTGVRAVNGDLIECGAVVSNSDSVRTHRELIEGKPAQKFLNRRQYEPACSGVVLYLGLKESYEHLLHHCFVFSRDAEEEFEAIYRKGEPAPDPTCYLAAPARTEPGVAPEGGEALYVLVHTPYLRDHHDWSKMLPEYRQVILDKLKRTAGMEDIEDRIEVEQHLTPQDIHERYHVLNGAIYGLASHGKFTGAFKPANRSKDVTGLYLAGGSAHPGPGMPMVLMSGWIAADTLDQDGVVSKSAN